MSFTPGAGTRFLVSTGASGTTPLSGPLSITGGTATTNTPVLSATQTWNNAAVTFTGWRLNVTDTASNASSLLMDLQVGGVSVFSVTKIPAVSGFTSMQLDGLVFAKQKNANNARIVINAAQIGMSGTGPGFTGPYVNSGSGFGWWSVNDIAAGGVIDLVLARDAADTLAQRNGVNAQTLRVYNTFTDASNYERGAIQWSGNELQIRSESAGTGIARGIAIRTGASGNLVALFSASNNRSIVFGELLATNATSGFVYVPTCAGLPTGTPETYTGRAPIVIDTTNNKLYFYSGGAWRDAGP